MPVPHYLPLRVNRLGEELHVSELRGRAERLHAFSRSQELLQQLWVKSLQCLLIYILKYTNKDKMITRSPADTWTDILTQRLTTEKSIKQDSQTSERLQSSVAVNQLSPKLSENNNSGVKGRSKSTEGPDHKYILNFGICIHIYNILWYFEGVAKWYLYLSLWSS